MKKSDIQRSWHQGHSGDPMINVKSHLWLPDLIRKYRSDGHEFGADEAFWEWLDETFEHQSYTEIDRADELARESCWEMAAEAAHEIWPQYSTEMVAERRYFPEYPPGCRWRYSSTDWPGGKVPRKKYHVEVWSAGRSGGWLVVSGLPDVDTWDAIELARWRRFRKEVRAIADEQYPYDLIWHLHVNVYEPDVLEPARQAADDGAQADADAWAAITESLETEGATT